MNEQQKAYQKLIQGVQNYVKDMVDKYSDKTYTGIIKAINTDGYTVMINGVQYPNIDTIGGSCTLNETVKVLVPQGNFSNMFILKAGNTSGSTVVTSGVTSVNGESGDVTIDVDDVGAVSETDVETTDIDFSTYFS